MNQDEELIQISSYFHFQNLHQIRLSDNATKLEPRLFPVLPDQLPSQFNSQYVPTKPYQRRLWEPISEYVTKIAIQGEYSKNIVSPNKGQKPTKSQIEYKENQQDQNKDSSMIMTNLDQDIREHEKRFVCPKCCVRFPPFSNEVDINKHVNDCLDREIKQEGKYKVQQQLEVSVIDCPHCFMKLPRNFTKKCDHIEKCGNKCKDEESTRKRDVKELAKRIDKINDN